MKTSKKTQREYQDYIRQMTPVKNLWVRLAGAFVFGGAICCLGQLLIQIGMNMGLNGQDAKSWCSIILIALSVILTGCNLYQKMAKYAGAGTLVPITGFANSMASAAIEFQKEGQVFGIGCKIFTIAGPVILYGVIVSSALGLGYWILKIL